MKAAVPILKTGIRSYDPDYLSLDDAAGSLMENLKLAGFAIVPIEPSEKMIAAAQDCEDPSEEALYRVMLKAASEEG